MGNVGNLAIDGRPGAPGVTNCGHLQCLHQRKVSQLRRRQTGRYIPDFVQRFGKRISDCLKVIRRPHLLLPSPRRLFSECWHASGQRVSSRNKAKPINWAGGHAVPR